MRTNTLRTLQALILGATGLFFLQKIWTGNLYWYINERFLVLVLLGAIGLLILAQVVFNSRTPTQPEGHEHPHQPGRFPWGLLVVALPVLLGILIPARPLGASAVANKGLLTAPPLSRGPVSVEFLLDKPASSRTILDWLQLVYALEDPQPLVGEAVDVVGFVYRLPELADDQFMVGRFAMTCCVADAYAIGMLVHWPERHELPENSWVRVQGSLEISDRQTQGAGRLLAGIQAQAVTPVGEPDQPYLYP